MFASTDSSPLKWPATPFEVRSDTEKHDRILMEVLQDASPAVRRSVARRDLVLDVAAALVQSLRPAIRPMAASLLTDDERRLVAAVVSTMIAYNLAFKQVRTEMGAYDYVLDPPLQDVLALGVDSKYSEVCLPLSHPPPLSLVHLQAHQTFSLPGRCCWSGLALILLQ